MLHPSIPKCALIFIGLLSAAPLSGQVDPDLLSGMKARSIGPAAMSGRVADIDAVAGDPNVIYVGAATGGLWKSVNGGLTWKPIFDDQPVAAIGSVAVFQPSPDIVWVGTGEGNPRNSASVGNGVYRSLDGGLTWTHLGLDGSERISRIVLHPADPEVAYVAALGQAWGENPERGVFKTTDGGRTWDKILFVDEGTGAADLIMDPSNPQKLMASLWSYRRWPWFFRSGGPGSGIYLTYNGGESWKRLGAFDGLPEGEWGRIGLAVAPSDPKKVYALVEAEKIGLYRSLDGGESWELGTQDRLVGNRPFYYADLRVDPKDPDRIYSLWSMVSVSNDGGKTFERLASGGGVHPDHHSLWIHPEDPNHLINGNDGGVYISRDRGNTWRFTRNLPLGQYYHIRVDLDVPYHVYGGMQDNGSWRGPSSVWEGGGIRNFHWRELYYGDGFDTLPDPADSMQGYAMSQQGYLARWNLRTGESKDIRPAPPGEEELRFNWNAGLAQDPFDEATIYYGSQYVHKSMDRGDTWTVISPDLTTDNPEWQKQDESGGLTLDVTGAENFTSIVAIAPSPLEKDLLWVGTDDGRLHLTRDGGENWTSVEKNVPGVPEHTWIPHIAPSWFDAGEVFVVFDDHRRSSWTPYVYKTTDFGATWTSLSGKEISGYALVIEQDPEKRDLLYLGTEFGLYISLNGGTDWFKWTHGVPTVSVMDLTVHPREHDLVLGTHGRSAYIVDDIRPLRSLTEELTEKEIHLFEIPPARQYRVARSPSTRSAGAHEYRGENRPYGALITFWLGLEDLPHPDREKERARKEAGVDKEEKDSSEEEEVSHEKRGPEAEIEIADGAGGVIRTFKAEVHLGVNRAVWDLRMDPFKEVERPGRQPWEEGRGPEVLPGDYVVRVKYEEHESEARVTVLADPRFRGSEEARRANFEAIQRLGRMQETATEALERIQKTQADIKAVTARMKKDEDDDKTGSEEEDLVKSARDIERAMKEVEELFWIAERTQDIPAGENVSRKIRSAMRSLQSTWDEPTEAQRTYMAQAESALQEALEEFNRFFATEVAAFRAKVRERGVVLLPEAGPVEFKDE
jgi:photosystem II stability/assembly factor-like uncharacterized protein